MQILPRTLIYPYLCIGFSLRGSNTVPVRHHMTQNATLTNALLFTFLTSEHIYYDKAQHCLTASKRELRLLRNSGIQTVGNHDIHVAVSGIEVTWKNHFPTVYHT